MSGLSERDKKVIILLHVMENYDWTLRDMSSIPFEWIENMLKKEKNIGDILK